MAEIITQSLASAYLVWIGVIMKVEGGLFSSFIFKVFPVGVGFLLGFHAYARFMGWPV